MCFVKNSIINCIYENANGGTGDVLSILCRLVLRHGFPVFVLGAHQNTLYYLDVV